MTGDTHYDLEVLAELAEGLLDETAAREVREHLAFCDACGERLADLAAVRELLASVPVPAMPLGVAKRIDRALAAEAPDWDRLMRDAPWENAPEPEPAPVSLSQDSDPQTPSGDGEPERVRLGVVADDGTIVPVSPRAGRRKTGARPSAARGGRRRWIMSTVAAAAVAVVVGSGALATGLIASGDGSSSSPVVAQPGSSTEPSRTQQKAELSYSVFASGHNYTSRELSGPLLGYFGVAPLSGTNEDEDLDSCVKRFASELDRRPIGVDKALYNGNEATIMAFWEDKSANAVRVVVVDGDCKTLRPDGLATWK